MSLQILPRRLAYNIPSRYIGVRSFANSTHRLLFKQDAVRKLAQSDGKTQGLIKRLAQPNSLPKTGSMSPPELVQSSIDPRDDPKYDKHKILRHVPRFLRPYTTQFIYAPVSHVTAFLILHELTAIVPLVGIWYVLHQHHDLFMALTLDLPSWALEKGTKVIDKVLQEWNFENYSLSDKIKFITEGAYAYVIVKALFPVRLAVSLLGMPFFARWFVLPFTRIFFRVRNTEKSTTQSPTKAHSAKEVPKPRI